MTIISERLQHLRLTHGYTQTELTRTMGHGCDPPGSLRMGARQMSRDPSSDPACPILSGVDRLSVGADGVRCSPPPEALPDTFCLL